MVVACPSRIVDVNLQICTPLHAVYWPTAILSSARFLSRSEPFDLMPCTETLQISSEYPYAFTVGPRHVQCHQAGACE